MKNAHSEPFMPAIPAIRSKIAKELEKGPNVSIIGLVDALIEEAHQRRASDIHIDPHERMVSVRFRIDGVLQDICKIPQEIQSEIISRIKVLAGLRTDEHQTAQDGRFRVVLEGMDPIDIRVSIAPAFYGENAVLRLLAERNDAFTLSALGFSKADGDKVIRAMKKSYGMILATGPTGSGKTTSLYTILKMLHTKDVSIITIEDPIEYAIEGINQIQVNAQSGLTFANGLRSMLRQDPDIIMVGEIRDAETAGLAVNTALTGHVVLSTLHTNDAATTLPRLIDLGVEPYLITATVNIAIGQRLVRKICEDCRVTKPLTKEEQKSLADSPALASFDVKRPVSCGRGCSLCNQSGYRGRIGIYEVLTVDDDIRKAMLERASQDDIRRIAISHGMTTMVDDGLRKVADGITTIDEVLRVAHE